MSGNIFGCDNWGVPSISVGRDAAPHCVVHGAAPPQKGQGEEPTAMHVVLCVTRLPGQGTCSPPGPASD